jgi:hypothetical protein
MRSLCHRRTALAGAVFALALTAGCAPKPLPPLLPTGKVLPAPPGPKPVPPDPALASPPDPEQARPVPYKGALQPGDPVQQHPPQRPLTPELMRELDALYERPAPLGPPPILRNPPSAVYAVGGGAIVRARLDRLPYGDSLPPERRVAVNHMGHYSNNVAILPRGEVRFAAFDRVLNDTRLSLDSMAFEASFTDEEGNDWRVLQTRIAPISPTPVTEPWFGGVVVDTPYHGSTKLSTEAEPTLICKMCSWGWANVWKNGKQVAASALLHVMLTTDVRDASVGYRYVCYECRDRPIRQIHLDIYPQSNLPTEDGGLHVMWQNSTYQQGSPDEIARSTPPIAGPGVPSLLINAVPNIRWSNTEISVPVGQPVRLILTNLDPASNHAFMMRGPGGPVYVPLPQGEQWTTMLVFNQPGEYEFWCPVANHRNRGMYGRIIVGGGVPGGTKGPPGGAGGDAAMLVLDMGHSTHHNH